MSSYVIDNYQVFYNAARGCLFFWCLLSILSFVWIIFMFIKKKLNQSTKDQVYKTETKPSKQQHTITQLKNAQLPDRKVQKDMTDEIQYQASEKNQTEEKKSDIVASAPKSQKPSTAQVEPEEEDSRTGMEKVLYGFEEFLFQYAPFICINVLNIVCIRTWEFNLVVWFLIMIPIVVVNLLGLFIKVENRFIQCLLKSIWVLVGVMWYVNFFTIRVPYRADPV